MSSSSSTSGVSNIRRNGVDGGKGIPRKCRCGQVTVLRTSESVPNPGRLYYICPFRSKEDKNHLFKWTDISMVEEMEEVERVIQKIEEEFFNLAMETRTCEAVVNRYGDEIKAMKTLAEGCKKEVEELKAVVKRREEDIEKVKSGMSCCKSVTICVLGVVLSFYFMSA
ncbi:unnamed protein product [Microthlaspi erraticum]|uniref:GRF-type domain-containing protein n=1 Tax=Microthlaspi erraticum TaxID=1685480 RepID=A0A6D2IZJ8_9BRAS|nr:unnamed protein product [Microthlaspi erraticum]